MLKLEAAKKEKKCMSVLGFILRATVQLIDFRIFNSGSSKKAKKIQGLFTFGVPDDQMGLFIHGLFIARINIGRL